MVHVHARTHTNAHSLTHAYTNTHMHPFNQQLLEAVSSSVNISPVLNATVTLVHMTDLLHLINISCGLWPYGEVICQWHTKINVQN